MTGEMAPLVIWGAAGQAKVIADFAPQHGFEIIALFDNDARVASPLPGVPIYHGSAGFEQWRAKHQGTAHFIVAIGGSRGSDRLALDAMLRAAGLQPATLVHASAFVATSARVGQGSVVFAHANVCAEARVGRGCIVNTAATIEHESVVADGAHVGPGAVLCGCVRVGSCAFIGAGAVVIPRSSVGEGAIVAAGAVVTRDVAPHTTVAGVPARPLAAPASLQR